ncbi:hypothetical protein [Methylophaga pinxianii]|uniref:hypothetical protein n=1 Tax=Methylophaga pinxianii TaxID=2881052 RepID=UPI001CF1437D|nr:hypothetical protein [Methylophaga pinxianii]MCB2427105.1 hypothetical protein [Methylophaga pinxianii]UPH45997.1 hypothetical protein LGT42_001580 [Methylophaga pinxianii]
MNYIELGRHKNAHLTEVVSAAFSLNAYAPYCDYFKHRDGNDPASLEYCGGLEILQPRDCCGLEIKLFDAGEFITGSSGLSPVSLY